MGIDMYMGHANFLGKDTVEINGKTLTFLKCCIATGGRPNIPNIEGIDKTPFRTSDSIFNISVQP